MTYSPAMTYFLNESRQPSHTPTWVHTLVITLNINALSFLNSHTVRLSDQRGKQQTSLSACVCVCMWESPSQQLLCQHPLSPGVGWDGGVHTAWLKNSSTTLGAVLGVWDDVLQTQPLRPAHTQKYMGPTVHTLTYCLLSSCRYACYPRGRVFLNGG